jgi:ABC-type sugar transport system ATPase subunit
MAAIEIDAVSRGYGDTIVLKGVSLTICDGEFLTLIGTSGCGKRPDGS